VKLLADRAGGGTSQIPGERPSAFLRAQDGGGTQEESETLILKIAYENQKDTTLRNIHGTLNHLRVRLY
jgi:hypothetical protein